MCIRDSYFLERVTDSIWALQGDGQIVMLPNGVDQYLEQRASRPTGSREPQAPARPAAESQSKPASGSAEERTARKTIARLDKQLARIAARETELNAQMAEKVADHEALAELSRQLKRLASEKDDLEAEWLDAASALE